jgi:hypothetical protein
VGGGGLRGERVKCPHPCRRPFGALWIVGPPYRRLKPAKAAGYTPSHLSGLVGPAILTVHGL